MDGLALAAVLRRAADALDNGDVDKAAEELRQAETDIGEARTELAAAAGEGRLDSRP